jgi:predicted transposase/invertase (TIGR01784 family)
MEIQNVHDKFFKETFSRVDIAINFLEEMVNDSFVQKLHLHTLKLENGSYIDEKLEESFADIIYTCQYGEENRTVKIALLYEHKSYREEYPHWQLVKYMVNVWQSGLKQKKVKPIPIIPIVIYHGKAKWKYQSMREYFENLDEDFFKYIPDFEYHLVDLSKFSDKKIANFRNKFLAISTLLFKHSRYKKYLQKIENEFVNLMKLIDNQEGYVFTQAIILYIENTDRLTITELIAIFSKVSINIKNTAMTTAEQLKSQGALETQIRAIKNGYLNGTSPSLLATLFELSVEKVEEIIAKIKLGLL